MSMREHSPSSTVSTWLDSSITECRSAPWGDIKAKALLTVDRKLNELSCVINRATEVKCLIPLMWTGP